MSMQITASSAQFRYRPVISAVGLSGSKNRPQKNTNNYQTKLIDNFLNYKAAVNKAGLSFKGYNGDTQPAKKLFWILTGRNHIYEDNYTKERLYENGNTGWKKWISVKPNEALSRTPEQAIQSICTLSNIDTLPSYIPPPKYGDKWGRHANYIEINPRLIAKHENGQVSEGLLNTIKMLPILPPSANKFANCLILSQLYPCYWNDAEGKNGFGSLYTVDLHSGISKNLTSYALTRDGQRMGDDELVRAFNDLAHLRGFKTGFRMPLSSEQITVQGRPFNWKTEKDAFIDACCWGIELGFDAIFFDSAKHVGFYDMDNYCGNGDLPSYEEMQEILYKIRQKTGRDDLSFVGEKCTPDDRFKEMGLNAGSDWGDAYNKQSLEYNSEEAKFNRDYSAGPDVSNDNDNGMLSWEDRYSRTANCLFGFKNVCDKLPIFMQMADIFPLSPNINTHEQMMYSNTYGKNPQEHYNNIFNTSDYAFDHQNRIYNLFKNSLYL